MKCAKIKDKKLLEISEIDEPIKDGEKVIIEVSKAGICGSDIHYWDAGNPVGLVMGHEFSGIVKDVGSRTDLNVGDRVTALPISPCGECPACKTGNPQYCPHTWDLAQGLAITVPGAFAKTIAVRPDLVIKVPDNVTDVEASMVEPTAVGLHAVHLADITVGAKVLIIGGGIIGLVSAMFARMEGASYVAVAEVNEARGKKAVDLGIADEFIDSKDPNFMNKVMEVTENGFDIVIECCGNSGAVSTAIMAVKPGGKVILVGVSQEPITIPMVVGVLREITMIGSIAYTEEEFKTCLELIEKEKIDVNKFVDKIVPLEDIQDAFVELTSGVSSSVKIIVDQKM